MIEKITLRIKELIILTRLLIAYLASKLFARHDKELWILSERGTDARDNGYWLFRYIKNNHPEINVKYIITKDSVDRSKLEPYKESLINYGSWKHYYSLCCATHLISTHNQGYTPFMAFFSELNKRFHIWKNKKVVMLQHGIIKDKLYALFYENTYFDLFIAGAKPEYDYLLKNFGYSDKQLKYTGLCRYDELINVTTENYILIMPTWRSWLNNETFIESEYFNSYKNLLESPEFQNLLSKNNVKAIFYPHYEIQVRYIEHFKALKLSNSIIIADMTYDVQQLLKGAKMLITDYSSVFFDVAYMGKPMVFYHFDNNRFFHEHYSQGYFDYSNSFGDVAYRLCELIEQTEQVIINDFGMQEKHICKTKEFFVYRDTKNCERVFNSIKDIVK